MSRRAALAVILVVTLLAGIGLVARPLWKAVGRTQITAYFDNSNGLYPGDDVLILGVRVGSVEHIEPQPYGARVTFWVDSGHPVPAEVRAAIIAPRLVTARSIQLDPVYTAGPVLPDHAVIPLERTAVPVEWDDLRAQLQKLSDSLQPSRPGTPSPLGAFINIAAANLHGQGAAIRSAIIELAQAVSSIGDHSGDIFATTRHLATLVSALQSSTDLMRALNQNLAAVTGLLVNDTDEVARAVTDMDDVADEVRAFVADNAETIGTTSDRLTSISTALVESLDDVEQTLHVAPNVLANFTNIYSPAHSSQTGVLAINQFANPIHFLCGAVEAASRLGAEKAAKLCAQYLAPIIKNRQYNFPPLGLNPFVGTIARPNELTYSEDWMRPDHRPSSTDPADGLEGLMVAAEPQS
ncbi:MCE family protein [Mycolicibacterium sp.]|uniref:MCE family protein n=1 Tax=Mycolicibacterium sp. TaxID=2320850 RepID=UPI003D0D2E94